MIWHIYVRSGRYPICAPCALCARVRRRVRCAGEGAACAKISVRNKVVKGETPRGVSACCMLVCGSSEMSLILAQLACVVNCGYVRPPIDR